MIQIRNVPDELHSRLKARAAAAGVSLSDYLKDRLSDMVALPTPDELAGTLERRQLAAVDDSIVEAIRTDRDAR